MADPTYPLFPVFAFIGFLLVLIPLPWHFEAWNSGTCYYMIWTAIACLNQFVNSVVWHNNALNPAPIWCDISTRISIGASVAIPAASLCIQMRLYNITCIQTVGVSRAEKRRAVLKDTLICVLFPMVCMVFYYIVQGHRFDIYEDIGCQPTVYDTIPSFFLVDMWPVVLGIISAVYCFLSITAFLKRRSQFKGLLVSTNITTNRYFRLMALAFTEMLLTVPLGTFSIYLNATEHNIQPWVNWANVHYDFSRIGQVPAVIWHLDRVTVIGIQMSRWAAPACAIIFFLFFGFAEEARRHYKLIFWWMMKPLGFTPSPLPSGPSGMARPPRMVPVTPILASIPSYTHWTPQGHKERAESLTGSLAAGDSDPYFDTEKMAEVSPSLPSPAWEKESTSHRFSVSALRPLPSSSDCPSIGHMRFESDPGQRISMSHAHVETSLPLPTHNAPAFHRPFSPPSIYPIAVPSAMAGSGRTLPVLV